MLLTTDDLGQTVPLQTTDAKVNQAAMEELNALYAKNFSMGMTQSGVGLLGAILATAYSIKKGYGFWSGAGFFLLGSVVTQVPLMIAMAGKKTANAARIATLQQQLNVQPPTFMQQLQNFQGKS